MNFENFKDHLDFVCQPAVRPGSTRCMAPEIQHSKGDRVGFMKLLFQTRFTYYAMAIPFIPFYIPLKNSQKVSISLLQLLLIMSHKTQTILLGRHANKADSVHVTFIKV